MNLEDELRGEELSLEGPYADFVRERFLSRAAGVEGLLHAAVGITTEGGEFLDAVKKIWVYDQGTEQHRANMLEELGDLEFYLEAARQGLGVSRNTIIQLNVLKLEKRYPNGYTHALAAARLDKNPNAPIFRPSNAPVHQG